MWLSAQCIFDNIGSANLHFDVIFGIISVTTSQWFVPSCKCLLLLSKLWQVVLNMAPPQLQMHVITNTNLDHG